MAYTAKQIESAKDKIIEGLYNGESLRSILMNDDKLPTRPIVYSWLNKDSEKFDILFLNNYVRAREDSADINADEIEDINQDVRKEVLRPDQARVIADNLKWIAGRKSPKKYGDKIQQELSGSVEQVIVRPKRD